MNRFVEKLRRLAPLDDGDVDVLLEATATTSSWARIRDVIRKGDRPGPVIVMLDGWACRYKILPGGSRQITAFLMPGDSCDLRAGLLAEMDHSIQTITAASIAMIPREQMDAILDARPRVARAMYISQLIDEGTLRAWITSMGRRTSRERVAHLMCELYLRARTIGLSEDVDVALPLSQVTLSDAVGLTPVHVNRVLRELRLEGAMTLERGSLHIADPVRLAQIAGFDENYLHRRMRVAAYWGNPLVIARSRRRRGNPARRTDPGLLRSARNDGSGEPTSCRTGRIPSGLAGANPDPPAQKNRPEQAPSGQGSGRGRLKAYQARPAKGGTRAVQQ